MFRKTLLLLALSLWSTLAFAHVGHPHHHRHSRHHRTTVSRTGVKHHGSTALAVHAMYAIQPSRYRGFAVAPGRTSEDCLATAIYWESKSEPAAGQAAVGYVVTNRAENRHFPNSVCGVVYQRNVGGRGAHRCQFSWSCKRPHGKINAYQMAAARRMARRVLDHTVRNPIGNALYFHEARLTLIPSRHAPYKKVLWGHAFYSPTPYSLATR